MREEIIALHRQTEALLQREGVAMGMTYVHGHDIHSYLILLRNPAELVHLQGYPGMSTPEQAFVVGRLMDTRRWLEIRQAGHDSIGNEHFAAITDNPFRFELKIPVSGAGQLAGVITSGLAARELSAL